MSIDDLTIKEARELAALFGGAVIDFVQIKLSPRSKK
jgi:hypothetical protein